MKKGLIFLALFLLSTLIMAIDSIEWIGNSGSIIRQDDCWGCNEDEEFKAMDENSTIGRYTIDINITEKDKK